MKSLYCGKDLGDSMSEHSIISSEAESSLQQYVRPKKKMHKNTEKPFQNKKKKSIVWKYFEYNPNEGIGICKICMESCSSKNSHTSHLIKHLKRWHPQVLERSSSEHLLSCRENQRDLELQSRNQGANNNIKDFFEKVQITKQSVLNFFKLDRLSNKAYCELCWEIIKVQSEKYKQLKDHMRLKHPCVMEEYKKQMQKPYGNINFEVQSVIKRRQENRNSSKQLTYPKNNMIQLEQNQYNMIFKNNEIQQKNSIQKDEDVIIVDAKQSITTSINSLYSKGPSTKELFDTVKQLQNKTKTALFMNNKDNKALFDINLNQSSLFCHLCDAKYFFKDKGTEPFVIHVQKIHLYKYEEQRRLEKINKNQSSVRLDNQDVDISGKQVQKKINYYRNSLPLSFDSIFLGQNNQSTNKELQYFLQKLKQIKQIKIKQKINQNNLKYLILLKNIPVFLKLRFLQDAISLWYVKQPTKEVSLKSVIYLISQDQKLCPYIIGAIFMLEETYQYFQSLLKQLSQMQLLKSQKLLIYGPQLLQKASRQFMHKQFCQMNHGIKCPKTVLLSDKINYKSSILAIDKYVHGLTQEMLTSSLDVQFLGFFFTKSFFRKVLQILPNQDRKITNLYELIVSLFKPISHASDEDLSKFKNLKKRINLAITSNHSMNSLKQILISAQVMMKIAVCFVFSLFLSTKQINQSLYEVYHCQGQQISAVEVFFDEQSTSWKCICQLGSLIGLPCPHIMAVLPKIDIPIYKFINERWISEKSINPKLFQKYQTSLATIQLSQRDFYDFLLT